MVGRSGIRVLDCVRHPLAVVTVATYTMGQALAAARVILVPLQTDARLSAADKAQITQCIATVDDALANLRADNTLPTNKRTSIPNALKDRCTVLDVMDRTRAFAPGELYNAIDLMFDCQVALRAGTPTIDTTL